MTGTDLIPTGPGATPKLYEKMHYAISRCFDVDDCKKIADEASAIAAYYKQIKDDASVKRFLQIKIRAWRRIGQIIITVSNEYQQGAETQAKYCQRTRERVDTGEMSDSHIIQAVRLAQLPDDFFEEHVEGVKGVDTLFWQYRGIQEAEWLKTPEGKAELERRRLYSEQYKIVQEQRQRDDEKAARERRKRQEEEEEEYEDYRSIRDEAFGEVGMTMDRRDRKEMMQVILLIREPIHAQLRQAAFDKKLTMQAVLRAGLKMWFTAHDYDTSDL